MDVTTDFVLLPVSACIDCNGIVFTSVMSEVFREHLPVGRRIAECQLAGE